MALGAQSLSPDTEQLLHKFFTENGFESSRPVLFPASRSNLVVTRDGEKVDVFAVFESDTNVWTWNYTYPPMTVNSVLVSFEKIPPEIFVVPTAALITLGEENLRRWILQNPEERDAESNPSRRVWKDQLSNWRL